MARLLRLALDQQLHHLCHRAPSGGMISVDDVDRAAYVDALLTVSREAQVAVHAYTVLPDRVQLLLTPSRGSALSTMMQRLGRRYVGEFNHRHARSGTPWAGRYRTTVLEPGAYLIDAMRLVDTAAVAQGLVEHPQQWLACSAAHHVGQRFDPLVTVHSGYWRLGNTPFERERAYGRLCEEPLPRRVSDEIQRATDGGWALGDGSFLAALAKLQARRLQPRRRGRVPSSQGPL